MIDMFHYSLIWLLLGSLILAIYIIFDADISNALFWWALGGIPIIVNCIVCILKRITAKRQEAEQQEAEQKHKNRLQK